MAYIAILGDPESIWIKTYVKEVLSDNSSNIVILTDKKCTAELGNEYPNNVKIVACPQSKWATRFRIDKYIYLIKAYFALKQEGRLDYLHVHFVNNRKLMLIRIVRRLFKKIIITFWGSDLLRKSSKELKTMERSLKYADRITVGSNEMNTFFSNSFPPEICRKVSVVRFGVNGLSPIYSLRTQKDELRIRWSVPKDKIVINIGYNGSEQQNHINVLDAINCISSEVKEKLFLIFPMTYGLEPNYLERIKNKAKETGCEFSILLDYLDSERIAELCTLTDVFIHAQKTDAFSASVQEYLCAGKLVLNPSWITYEELKEAGVFYWEYTSFDDITNMIFEYVTCGIPKDKIKQLEANKECMFRLSSWDSLRHKWQALYD